MPLSAAISYKSKGCSGGYKENSLWQTLFHRHYRKKGQELFYVPELCVSIDEEQLAKVKPQLEKRDINPISYERALMIISQPARPASALRRA